MRFFLSPLVFIAGVLLMKYSVQVTNMTGKFDFAEKWFGTGIGAGTYTWWKLFGLALCILAALWFFNKLPGAPKGLAPEGSVSIILQMLV